MFTFSCIIAFPKLSIPSSIPSDNIGRFLCLDALQARLGTISLEAQTKLEKDTAKKEAKAEAKANAELKKKMASQVRVHLIYPLIAQF